jgi:hypothetical protein
MAQGEMGSLGNTGLMELGELLSAKTSQKKVQDTKDCGGSKYLWDE